MSFKYRFILSFVLLEIFFIVLIVLINFYSIKDSSNRLINEKIESNISFLEELIKIPMSIYDLATLDNLAENSAKYVNSIIVLDNQNRILSSLYSYKYMPKEELIKLEMNKDFNIEGESYKIKFKKIYEDDIFLGSMYIIFDTTSNTQFIEKNKQNTILIILIEILISTLLSYLIGHRLTEKLSKLSSVALKIGKLHTTEIPFREEKGEIGILANSMHQMQNNLINRNKEIRESNKLLKKQKNDLITANQVKDDFLANMSHELKTPLNSINVISAVMKKNSKKNLNDSQIKNLEIINNCGNDLLYLINDVLDISKLDAGKVSVEYKEININHTILLIKDMFIHQFENKHLNFEFEFDESIDLIYSDENKIKQIVKNLLSNALKFTDKGRVSLKVKDENENLTIIVEDEGIGISKEKLLHIFDRFKQVDTSISRKHLGTGLGLAICRELTELLDGKLSVESKLHEGTKFSLTLPKDSIKLKNLNLLTLKDDNALDNKTKGKTELIVSKEKNNQTIKKILIYNSNPIELFTLIIELQKDYKVIQVNTKNKLNDMLKHDDINALIINADPSIEVFIEEMIKDFNKNKILISSNERLKIKDVSIIDKAVKKEELIKLIEGKA